MGGRLHLDGDALRFEPNGFEAMTGCEPVQFPLAEVAGVDVEPARWTLGNLFSGGLRARLALDLTDGRRELFVVWNPKGTAEGLRTLLESR